MVLVVLLMFHIFCIQDDRENGVLTTSVAATTFTRNIEHVAILTCSVHNCKAFKQHRDLRLRLGA